MRLSEIKTLREELSGKIQPLTDEDISLNFKDGFEIYKNDSIVKSVKRRLGAFRGSLASNGVKRGIPSIPFRNDVVTMGERFAESIGKQKLYDSLQEPHLNHVLIPGCYMGGEDVQGWLRMGAKRLTGIDVYSLQSRWDRVIPPLSERFGSKIRMIQASIEDIPIENGEVDLICSHAVLEHVRNLDAMAAETARILRPGGLCYHSFGPLYYSFGADHCISAYGFEHGFDHLLLEERDYQSRIHNQSFFDTQPDKNLPFWALHNQFSFSTAGEYLRIFKKHFEVDFCLVKISDQSIEFRDTFPEKWKQLIDSGVDEIDLLIKSAIVILRKT